MKHLNTIFILGYPRSGTTWFANLFNSHPDVVYRHEVIGRCYKYFPKEMFHRLKHDYGLADDEYKKSINIILSPNVESGRAPFFPKNYLVFKNTRFHYISWIISRTLSIFEPLYRFIFFPRSEDVTLIIKGTRSTVNMVSMLTGLRADRIVVLFRHPCGAIASSLTGIQTGKMHQSTASMRETWFAENKDKSYIKELNLSISEIRSLPEYEYLAILRKQQNDDYLAFTSTDYDKIFISNESFMADQENKVKELFEKLSLNYDLMVDQFLNAASGSGDSKPILKDSSSKFYSVYRSQGFDPNRWQIKLLPEQISAIEKHSLITFNRLLEFSNN